MGKGVVRDGMVPLGNGRYDSTDISWTTIACRDASPKGQGIEENGRADTKAAIRSIFTITAGARRDHGSALTLGALR